MILLEKKIENVERARPQYDRTAHFSEEVGPVCVNCCWCGGLIKELDSESKQKDDLKKDCSKCGKPNYIRFRWSLITEAYPIK